MTAPERLSDTGPWRDWFERAMNSGAPIVDNASDRPWGPNGQYDGPRCIGEDCTTPVDDDNALCDDCGDQPHEFRSCGDPRWSDWCACGRPRSVGGYSLVHTDQDDGERDVA